LQVFREIVRNRIPVAFLHVCVSYNGVVGIEVGLFFLSAENEL
jgi:hypothetical protein